jgi:hypothetical protein
MPRECAISDSPRYDEWYDGILQYSYESNEVMDILTSDVNRNMSHNEDVERKSWHDADFL